MNFTNQNPIRTPARIAFLERTGTAAIYGIPSITTSDSPRRCVQAEPDLYPRRLFGITSCRAYGDISPAPMNTAAPRSAPARKCFHMAPARRVLWLTFDQQGRSWIPPAQPKAPRSTAVRLRSSRRHGESGCKTGQCLVEKSFGKDGQCSFRLATAVRSPSSDQPGTIRPECSEAFLVYTLTWLSQYIANNGQTNPRRASSESEGTRDGPADSVHWYPGWPHDSSICHDASFRCCMAPARAVDESNGYASYNSLQFGCDTVLIRLLD